MSGWTRRRSSGEIINATLLEVFLALSFMVFALAVFYKQRAEAAERRELPPGMVPVHQDTVAAWRDMIPVPKDSLVAWRGRERGQAGQLAAARRTIDSLKFASPYPPDCEPGASPAELLTVTLAGPSTLRVEANRPRFGLALGETLTLSPAAFRARFAQVRAYSMVNGCRFLARIEDTPAMPKTGFKGAMAAVSSVFRPRGAYR